MRNGDYAKKAQFSLDTNQVIGFKPTSTQTTASNPTGNAHSSRHRKKQQR